MDQVNHQFQVMTYDIDFAGIVSNISYIRWLEDLRNLYADKILSIDDALNRGIVPALARTEIDYLLPVRFPDTVTGKMWLSERGRAKFILSSEFTSKITGLVTAQAKQIGVFVSRVTFHPVPLPEEFKLITLPY
jgi:acyl-CoA thioester hydrolase